MSKMVQAVKAKKEDKNRVVNFMGGYSYVINPLDTLKMVTASSIFGEPQYYREGEFAEKAALKDGRYSIDPLFADYSILDSRYDGKKTSDIMEDIIDKSLDYDFKATLEWAVTLRKDFYMRLNPQVIMVRAAIHPKRAEFTAKNPGLFNKINEQVMRRADEPASQLTYYLYRKGSKNNVPGILKKGWSMRLSNATAYEINKYKNTGIGMIDTVRVCHANSKYIDELMRTGTLPVSEDDQKWETLRAEGMSWKEILTKINVGHMALLRNLRGIFTEINDYNFCQRVMEKLKAGVKSGKQFPFRYDTARKIIDSSYVNHKQLILDTLEECMDIASENLPKLKGRTMCLSDNSGSAWCTLNSEFGTTKVATIGNLSSVITSKNSDEGFVGVFGDQLAVIPVSKREGILKQTEEISNKGMRLGMSTENGIWIFFRDAIDKKEHWDNIVIYSDMQAGHGGLYGNNRDCQEYRARGFACKGHYIDVAKLIEEYRNKVNPKVNVYCVQTAGYDNVLVPEYGYRTNIFYGWTGKELVFIDTMNKFWDEKDAEKHKDKPDEVSSNEKANIKENEEA